MSESSAAVAEEVAMPGYSEGDDGAATIIGCAAVGAVTGLLGRSVFSVLRGSLLGLALGVTISAMKKNGGIDIEGYGQGCAEDVKADKSAVCVSETEQEVEL